MEGPHGELGSRLTDGLGCDDSDCFANLDHVSRGEGLTVAISADALAGLTGQRRANPNPGDRFIVAHGRDHLVAQHRAGLECGLVAQHDILNEDTTIGTGLHVGASSSGVRNDILDPDTPCRPAVELPDDELLSHIDESTGQVTGVSGPQCSVSKTPTGAVRRDEVLEDAQALAEARLDRPRNHLTARVGHEALHAGDLTDLLCVSSGP